MRDLILVEIGKAVRNRWFMLSLAAAMIVALASAIGNFLPGYSMTPDQVQAAISAGKFIDEGSNTSLTKWISLDMRFVASTLFYYLLPLLAVVPYACSFRSEARSGYAVQMCVRVERVRYYLAKYVAVFLAGGMVAFIPQILNFVILSCFFPLSVPSVVNAMYIGVIYESMWSIVFYNQPLLYVLGYCLLGFVVCGLWAGFVLSLSLIVSNRVLLVAVPYLSLFALQFVNERIFHVLGGIRGLQLSLFENLRALSAAYLQNGWVITAECLALLAVSAVLAAAFLRRDLL